MRLWPELDTAEKNLVRLMGWQSGLRGGLQSRFTWVRIPPSFIQRRALMTFRQFSIGSNILIFAKTTERASTSSAGFSSPVYGRKRSYATNISSVIAKTRKGLDWRQVLSLGTGSASIHANILNSEANNSLKSSTRIRRDSHIAEEMVGLELQVHNGRAWRPVRVSSDRVGFRTGDFIATTTFSKTAGRKQKPGKNTRTPQNKNTKRKRAAKK